MFQSLKRLLPGNGSGADAAPAKSATAAAVDPLQHPADLKPWEDKALPMQQRIDAYADVVHEKLEEIQAAYAAAAATGDPQLMRAIRESADTQSWIREGEWFDRITAKEFRKRFDDYDEDKIRDELNRHVADRQRAARALKAVAGAIRHHGVPVESAMARLRSNVLLKQAIDSTLPHLGDTEGRKEDLKPWKDVQRDLLGIQAAIHELTSTRKGANEESLAWLRTCGEVLSGAAPEAVLESSDRFFLPNRFGLKPEHALPDFDLPNMNTRSGEYQKRLRTLSGAVRKLRRTVVTTPEEYRVGVSQVLKAAIAFGADIGLPWREVRWALNGLLDAQGRPGDVEVTERDASWRKLAIAFAWAGAACPLAALAFPSLLPFALGAFIGSLGPAGVVAVSALRAAESRRALREIGADGLTKEELKFLCRHFDLTRGNAPYRHDHAEGEA